MTHVRSLAPLDGRIVPHKGRYPEPRAILTLLKPITWFPPMWAYGCGVVSSGQPLALNWHLAVLGILLAGPLVCGTSQAVNDWFDRHVDAINEPNRPIPSGRVPGRWGLYIAILWSALSLLVSAFLGAWVFIAAVVGLTLAWAYSAPPVRLKSDGWYGNAAVGLCYEGLPWFTGTAALIGGLPDAKILALAFLYSLGAHGIMTLNDFKSIGGDQVMGVRSLPVQLGAERAAKLACIVMALPQILVIGLLFTWGAPIHAGIIGLFLAVQFVLMRRLLADPKGRAPWYNGTGITLYVFGMLVSAFAVRALIAGG
jgi:chlorophyll/bacteriochlorophyll a synthase